MRAIAAITGFLAASRRWRERPSRVADRGYALRMTDAPPPPPIDPAFVTTLAELPGYVVVAAHGIVADVGTAAGRTARNKGVDSFREALKGISWSASAKGANAIVGLQVGNFGSSIGGTWGDAVGTTLLGTAVTVRPVTQG
jgi:uncharacterized protein YbjQ (UPF0145 family)